MVYVALFGADRLVAIDAVTLDVVGVVQLGSDPFDVAFVVAPDGRMEAWVTEFGAGRVTIIDVDPDSETRHEVVGYVR